MNFLNPNFLYGLFAIAIPIAIHLFNLQKPKKVFFTNVDLLRNVSQKTNSILKIKHWLVLLCRVLFIVFLVLAFAQPFIKKTESTANFNSENTIIYLDNSLSMQAGNSGENLLDQSVKEIENLSEALDKNTRYKLYTNDDFSGNLNMFNKEKLKTKIQEVSFTSHFKSFDELIKKTHSQKNNITKQNIFLLSDFQKSTLGRIDFEQLDSNSRYYLIPMSASDKSNIYVDSVWLNNPLVRVNEPNSISAKLMNTGNDAKKINLKLYIDEQQSNVTELEIPAQGETETTLNFNVNSFGFKPCKLVFEDNPIVFDNSYYFVLNSSPKIKILNLYDSQSEYVEKVYANEILFEIKSNPIGQVNYSDISVSNLIILNQITQISESLISELENFINKGGSLLILPNTGLDFSKLSTALKIPKFNPIALDTSSQSKLNFTLSPPKFSHPFFKNIFEKSPTNLSLSMPFAFPSHNLASDGEAILEYKNGNHFLSKFSQKNNGKTYVCAAPFLNQYTNITQHSLFVAIMYKIAFESMPQSEQIAFDLQNPDFTLTLPESWKEDQKMFVLKKDSLELIPTQRLNGRLLTFSLANNEVQSGIYLLNYGSETLFPIAFNGNKLESINQNYESDSLKKIALKYSNVKIYESNTLSSFTQKFTDENIGISLWKYSMLLSLAFLILEIILIRFYK